jgi:hypothetical protein
VSSQYRRSLRAQGKNDLGKRIRGQAILGRNTYADFFMTRLAIDSIY